MIPHDVDGLALAVDHGSDDVLSELSENERRPWPARRSDRRPHVPLVEWLQREPDLLGRAGYATAVRCAVSREDADDAVQEAVTVAWERGLKLRGAAEAQAWLRREARKILVVHRHRTGAADVAWDDAPSGWTAAAMEAIVDARSAAREAVTDLGARALPLLVCLAGDATLAEAGDVMGELTRERARQCRDALAVQLRRWAERGPLRRAPIDLLNSSGRAGGRAGGL